MTDSVREVHYGLVDMDNHYYECEDSFTRHIEPAYRDQAIHLLPGGVDQNGEVQQHLTRWGIGDEPLPYLTKNLAQRTRPPGAILGVFEGTISRNELAVTENWNPREELPAAFVRDLRLKAMEQQNVEACLMLPSQALTFQEDLVDRPDVWLANLRSFNRWLEEDWGFGKDGKIYAVPMISLLDVDEALRELEWILAAGAKAFYFKMGTVQGVSAADERFDPFWARVNESGIRPVLHIDNHGYEKIMVEGWGMPKTDGYYQRQTAAHKFLSEVWRPVHDTVGMLILHNLFGRFPNIKMIVVESGSDWVEPLMSRLDKSAKMAMDGAWSVNKGRIDGRLPSEVLRDHFWIAPFPEDDVADVVRVLGEDQVLFGSDWPHSEGEAEPSDYLRRLGSLSDEQVRKIMRDNGLAALGLS
jgi:predicted TIM-barrel fold metal-dependent hydrolase